VPTALAGARRERGDIPSPDRRGRDLLRIENRVCGDTVRRFARRPDLEPGDPPTVRPEPLPDRDAPCACSVQGNDKQRGQALGIAGIGGFGSQAFFKIADARDGPLAQGRCERGADCPE
jgi:hypothetical protein